MGSLCLRLFCVCCDGVLVVWSRVCGVWCLSVVVSSAGWLLACTLLSSSACITQRASHGFHKCQFFFFPSVLPLSFSVSSSPFNLFMFCPFLVRSPSSPWHSVIFCGALHVLVPFALASHVLSYFVCLLFALWFSRSDPSFLSVPVFESSLSCCFPSSSVFFLFLPRSLRVF